MNDDPRLIGRKKYLLEQIKMISELLQKDIENIDWELIARLGEEIDATAKTAKTLVINKSKKYKL
jgi:protein-arginine kinase activator protein McsA